MVRPCKLAHCLLWLAMAIAGAGCAARVTVPAPLAAMSDDLDVASLRAAIGHSLAYLQKLPPERIVGEQPRPFAAREIEKSLIAFNALLDRWPSRACLAREIAAHFELIASSVEPRGVEVLFTGYYQPIIDASLTPSEQYRYPIYAVPGDLVVQERDGERKLGRIE